MSRQFFGTDGIRDVAGQGRLAPDRVAAYGQALGVWLNQERPRARVLVGRDTRRSGPTLLDQLSPGFLASGHTLVDGGVLPTPAVQTLCREEGFDLAIVISASHNPAEDNGLKFFGGDGRKLPDAAEEALESLTTAALDRVLEPSAVSAPGTREVDETACARYVAFVLGCFPSLDLSGVSVVLDCAHGAGSEPAPQVLMRLGATVHLRGAEPDGDNINDGAGVFNVADLADEVRSTGSIAGLALDGDADRVLMVDENGDVRDGDHMLGLLAKDLAAQGNLPGDRLITTVMANLGLKVFLSGHDIACEMTPVGDRFVAARMDESASALGGEQSGHVIFRDADRWFGDGLYTALRVLEVVRRAGQPLSELCHGVEKYPQILVNVRVREKPPTDAVPDLVAAQKTAEADLGDEGRVVLRYSGTEPLLRVMVEGKDIEKVQRHVDAMVAAAEHAIGVG